MENPTIKSAPSNVSFSIRRGIKSNRCLSLASGWSPREKWITINDFLEIAAKGYDQVRLPVDEKVLWKANGERDEETFTAISRIVSHARTAGLKLTVDVCEKNAATDKSVWRTKTDLKSIFGKGEALEARAKAVSEVFHLGSFVRALLAVA